MKPSSDISTWRQKLLTPAQWFVILVAISVPISTAFDNLLLALVLLLAALLGQANIARIAVSHPVARAAVLLFLWLSVAMFHGMASWEDALATWGKYLDLLFIPVFIFLLSKEEARRRVRQAFLMSMGITLVLSCLVWMEWLPVMGWMDKFTTPSDAAIFRSHITQSNMMAFAVLLALLEWREAHGRTKAIWGAFALLAAINVLYMVQGRTGYLILIVLMVWFGWTSFVRKFWLGAFCAAGILLIGITAYLGPTQLRDRVGLVSSEYRSWQPGQGSDTSTGQRLDFYINTIEIIRAHPVWGVGTGGFPAAFAQQVADSGVAPTRNPHNEYLMIAAQTGLPGLALLLFLFYTQWRYAARLLTTLEQDAARGLVLAYLVNSMLNSALHDHADGLFFALMTAALFAGLRRESARG